MSIFYCYHFANLGRFANLKVVCFIIIIILVAYSQGRKPGGFSLTCGEVGVETKLRAVDALWQWI